MWCWQGEETLEQKSTRMNLTFNQSAKYYKMIFNVFIKMWKKLWQEFVCQRWNTPSCYKEARWQCVCVCMVGVGNVGYWLTDALEARGGPRLPWRLCGLKELWAYWVCRKLVPWDLWEDLRWLSEISDQAISCCDDSIRRYITEG